MLRACVPLTLVLVALAGCTDPAPAEGPQAFPLDVYRFAYPGSDVAVQGFEHGWLIRVANPTSTTYRTTILPQGLQEALLGPVASTSGDSPQTVFLPTRLKDGGPAAPTTLTLAPGESGVFLVKVIDYGATGTHPVGFRAFAAPDHAPEQLTDGHRVQWEVEVVPATTAVMPGDHVQTVTVGVWVNGTSFYTNSADLIADPAFPAGFSRDDAAAATEPLPVYVYDQDRDEQPAGSQDTCHFTTITGYNRLVKAQAEASTGVGLMRPEDAYTQTGNEDHALYGDPLIFLNTVVAHDGATGPLDMVPDPLGACFSERLDDVPLPTMPAP